jgi:elongation factor P
MIDSGELRKGITIELEGGLYRVIEYQHLKLGRGSAQVRLKLRSIQTGHIIERTFQASEKFTPARLERRATQYLYSEGSLYFFMDTESFEQIPLDATQLGDAVNYLKEGMTLEVSSYKDRLVGVELPTAVVLQVTETGPSFKGDTTTAGSKPATLETGLLIQVPFFINKGDIIKVDTRTGEYLERVAVAES